MRSWSMLRVALAALIVPALLALPALSGCAREAGRSRTGRPEPAAGGTQGRGLPDAGAIRDSDLGLSRTGVGETPDPIVAPPVGGEPGENERLERAFEGAPPVIPHAVEGFLPITAGENLCLGCHGQPDRMGEAPAAGEPTPIPPSHYTDHRRSPGRIGRDLVGARWVCLQCHVTRSQAAPLVESTFGG